MTLAEFPDGWRSATVIVADPDDIEWGLAVGVRDVEFLGLPDGHLVEGLELRRTIAAAIRRHRPEVVVGQHFGERWGDDPGAGATCPASRTPRRRVRARAGPGGAENLTGGRSGRSVRCAP